MLERGTNGGNWSNAANWTSRVPLPQDDVVINASFGASQTITADMARLGKSINWTGATGSPTFAINSTPNTIYGSLTLISGMTLTTGQTLTFEGRNSFTFTSGGKTFGSITMQMLGGTLTMQDHLTLGSANTFTLNNGTFDANGFNVTTGFFSSNNSNTRTITMGSGTWTLTGNAGTIWTTSTSTNLTLNRGNAITANYSGSTGTRTISLGSLTEASAPSFSITAGTDIVAITGSVLNLNFTGFAGTFSNGSRTIYGNLTIASGMTLSAGGAATTFAATSGIKTITSNGKTMDFPIIFDGVGGTWQLADAMVVGSTRTTTLTNGTFDSNGKSFTTGLFSSSNSNVRTIMGDTWTISGTGTVWDLLTTTGLTFNPSVPNLSFSGSSQTIKTGNLSYGAMSFASSFPGITIIGDFLVGTVSFPNALGAPTMSVNGSWNVGSITNSFNPLVTLTGSGTTTITSNYEINGHVANIFDLTINGSGGTFQLADNLHILGSLTVTAGTFDANGHDVTVLTFASSNSNTRTITMGSGTWSLWGLGSGTVWDTSTTTNLTLNRGNAVVSSYSGSSTRTISAGSLAEANAPSFSITAGTGTINITGSIYDLNFTGFTGTLANGARTVYGNLTVVAGMTLSAGASTTTFGATSGTKTITSNGKTFDFPVTFDGVGGTWQLGDDLTVGSTRTVTLTNGTFDANGKNFNTGIFSSNNSNTRVITIGAGTWTLTGSATTIWNTSTSTNLTINRGTAIRSSGTTRTITGSSTEAGSADFLFNSGSDTVTITAGVHDLDFTGFTGTLANSARTVYGNLTIVAGMTLTASANVTTFGATSGTKTITSNGKTLDFPITFDGVGGSWQLGDDLTVGSTRTVTLTNGTLDANGHNFSMGLFSSSNANTRTITMGAGTWTLTGNAGIIWTTSTSTNLTLNRGNAIVSNYSGSTGTRTITGSLTETASPAFNITAGTDTVAITGGVYDLNFTGFGGTLSNGGLIVYGNLTVAAGMTLTAGGNATTFAATSGTKTITTNGKTLDFPLFFNGVGGTWQLADDLTVGSSRTVTLINGTFDANGHNFTTGIFSSNNSNIRTITMGGGTWTLTGNNATVWSLLTTTNLTFNRGNAIIVNYSGSTGTRTFAGFLSEASAPSFSITAGTDTVDFNASTLNLDFTGFAGTWSNDAMTIYGNLTVSSGMTLGSGANIVTFGATSGTKTITSNGKTFDFFVRFDGVGGTFQLADDLTVGSSRTVTLINGTFDANGKNLTTGRFSSSNSNVRTITMGAGTWTLTGNNATIWDTGTSTNLTLNRGNAIVANYSGSTGTRTITGSSTEAASPDFNITAGTDILAITGGIRNLDFTGFAGTLNNGARTIYGNLTVVAGMTLSAGASATTFGATSGTKTITSNGKTLDFPLTFNGVGGTWQLGDALTVGATRTVTLTNGTLDLNGQTVSMAGGVTANGGTLANNSGTTTLSAPITLGSATAINVGGTQLTLSGVITGAGNNLTVSGAGDTILSGGSITGAGTLIVNNSGSVKLGADLDVDGNITLTAGTLDSNGHDLTVGGNWTDTGAGTFTEGNQAVTFDGTGTINANEAFHNVTINTGGTVTLGTDLQMNGALTVTSGTLALAGFNIADDGGTTATLNNIAGTIQLNGNESVFWTTNDTDSGTWEYVGTGGPYTIIDFGAQDYYDLKINSSGKTFNLGADLDVNHNLTITAGTLDVTAAGCSGASCNINVAGTWNNADTFNARTGTVTLDGTNQSILGATTFYDLTKTITGASYTLTFENSQTQTIGHTLRLEGESGNLLLLRSDSDGTQWKIDPQGTRTVSYLDVKDSNNLNVTAIACSTGCVDAAPGSTNTNWTFGGLTLTVTGITASNKTYDGNTTAVLDTTNAVLVGIQNGDDVTLVVAGATGSFANKNVGTGKTVTIAGLTLAGADAGKYTLTQPTATADITAKALTVSNVTANGKTYDANTTASLNLGAAAFVGVVGGDTVNIDTSSATGTFSDKNVGTGKTVTVAGIAKNGADAGNYTITQPTTTADITAKTLTVSNVTANGKTYDANTTASLNLGTAAFVGVVGGDTVNIDTSSATGTFSNKNVGTGKTVTVAGIAKNGADAGNYTITQPTTTADITAKALTVSNVTANGKTYDGNTTASLNLGTAAFVGVVGGDTVNIDTSSATGTFSNKNVGTGKTVTVAGIAKNGADAGNYTITQPTTTADITAKALTVSNVTANGKTYDGNTTASLNLGTAAFVGVVGGDTVNIDTSSATGTFSNKNVGTGKTVTVAGIAKNGADAGNYTITQPTTTADITAKALTVSNVTANGKTYDANTTASLNLGTAAFVGVVGGDTVNIDTASATGTFSDKNIGTGKTVTVAGIAKNGADAGNYTITQPTTTADITAKALTVSNVTANGKTYDANTTASLNLGTAAFVGVVGGDTVNIDTASATGTFSDKNVGTGKTVTVAGIAKNGADAGNYTITQPTTTADITAKNLTVSNVTANGKTYDANTTASLNLGTAAFVGVVGGDTVNIDTSSATGTFANKNVGIGKTVTVAGITKNGADAGNYTITQPTTTADITAKALTVSNVTANGKTYDANTTASLNLGTAAFVGVVGGDTVNIDTSSATGTFANKNIGTGKTVTVAGIAKNGADAGNYTITQPTTTADITAKALTVSNVTANGKTYDANTTASLNLGTAAFVGVVGGDTVNIDTASATGTFSDKNIGTGKTVTVAGITKNGADAGNYTITQPTTTADITAKALTVSNVTANSKTYDANTTASLNLGAAAFVGVVGGDTVNIDTASATGTFSDKNIGTGKTVTVAGIAKNGADAGNYTITQPTTTADITAKNLTVSNVTANGKTYDGNTTASLNLGTAAFVGVVGGDTVNIDTSSATGTFANKNVGIGKTVTVAGIAKNGADAGNYTITQPTTTADITAKNLTVSNVTANGKTYDANTTASLNLGTAAFVGVVGGDTVNIDTSSATGTFANKNVGIGKTVTVAGITKNGADAGNYTITQPTTTADITAKNLTVSGITANNKVYDATTAASINVGSAALVGVVGGDTVTLGTGSASGTFINKNVANGKVVNIAGLTIGGADSSNYNLTQPATTANITPATLTVGGTFTVNNKTYDATTAASINNNSLVLVGVIGGETVTLNPVLAFNDKNVANGKAVSLTGASTLGGADNGNYSLSLVGAPTATANVTPATLTVSGITANNKVYDTTNAASINVGSAALVGVRGGDVVNLDTTNVSATFNDDTIATGKTVTISGLTIGGADSGNYNLTQPTTTADITAFAPALPPAAPVVNETVQQILNNVVNTITNNVGDTISNLVVPPAFAETLPASNNANGGNSSSSNNGSQQGGNGGPDDKMKKTSEEDKKHVDDEADSDESKKSVKEIKEEEKEKESQKVKSKEEDKKEEAKKEEKKENEQTKEITKSEEHQVVVAKAFTAPDPYQGFGKQDMAQHFETEVICYEGRVQVTNFNSENSVFVTPGTHTQVPGTAHAQEPKELKA